MACPQLHRRAKRWLRLLRRALGSDIRFEITLTQSQVGGGALPLSTPDSYALGLTPRSGTITELEKHLRSREIPIIGRIEKERLLLDLRTLQEADRPVLIRGLKEWISPVPDDFLMSSFFLANPKNWWSVSDLVRKEIGPLIPFNDLFLIPSSAAPAAENRRLLQAESVPRFWCGTPEFKPFLSTIRIPIGEGRLPLAGTDPGRRPSPGGPAA